MLLFLLRHADPVYEPDDITTLGLRQAEALAYRLSKNGIDKIYSSSSNRAIRTALPTSKKTKREIEVLDWANEKHLWLDLTVKKSDGGLTWCFSDKDFIEFFQTEEIRTLGARWYEHKAFSASNYKSAMQRIDKEADLFLENLGYRHSRERGGYIPLKPNDSRVAFFAHHGFGVAFLSSILDIPFPTFATRFDISHSGMTVVDFSGEGNLIVPKILQLSNDSHLYKFGIPTKYNNYLEF